MIVVNAFLQCFCDFVTCPFMDRKMFATRIDKNLLKSLKLLSVIEDKPINTLLEEAIQNLLIEYEKKEKEKPTTHYRIIYKDEQPSSEADKTKKKRTDK